MAVGPSASSCRSQPRGNLALARRGDVHPVVTWARPTQWLRQELTPISSHSELHGQTKGTSAQHQLEGIPHTERGGSSIRKYKLYSLGG